MTTENRKPKFIIQVANVNLKCKVPTMDKHQYGELVGALSTDNVESVVARLESLKRRCYDADAFQKGNEILRDKNCAICVYIRFCFTSDIYKL